MNLLFKTDLKSRVKKLVVFVFIIDVLYWLQINNFLGFSGSTIVSSTLAYISIFIVLKISHSYFNKYNSSSSILFFYRLWIFICVIGVIRGVFFSDNYWDIKYVFVSGIPLIFVSLLSQVGNKLILFKYILDYYLDYIVLIALLFIPLTFIANQELFSRLVVAISIFIVFIPYLKKKKVLIIILVTAISIALVIGFRTNILKVTFSILILGCYYYRNIVGKRIITIAFLALFLSPIFFLSSAISGDFNILNDIGEKEGYIIDGKNGQSENFVADTRTLLYRELITSVVSSDDILFGSGASGKYSTIRFENTGGGINGFRYRCEVHFLNVFLYFGFVGVISYTLLLLFVCYQGIYNSKNILAKMLSLLIASRFLLSFIEEFTQYDMNFFFFWLIIGLVSSRQFRSMSDQQVKSFFK